MCFDPAPMNLKSHRRTWCQYDANFCLKKGRPALVLCKGGAVTLFNNCLHPKHLIIQQAMKTKPRYNQGKFQGSQYTEQLPC